MEIPYHVHGQHPVQLGLWLMPLLGLLRPAHTCHGLHLRLRPWLPWKHPVPKTWARLHLAG